MVTRNLERPRPRSGQFPVSNADEHTKGKPRNLKRPHLPSQRTPDEDTTDQPRTPDKDTTDQLMLYRTVLEASGLLYLCPICLLPCCRPDVLYRHIRQTEEVEHRKEKALWLDEKCPFCDFRSSAHVLFHVAKRHPSKYQSLMKSALRIRPDTATKIPEAPQCFDHTFLIPLRRPDRIVRLPRPEKKRPRKKQKAEHQSLQQDIDNHLEARMGIAPPPHTSGYRTGQLYATHPLSVGTSMGMGSPASMEETIQD